jgi:ectoine hydroxylase-related dioxygenase (phytanoyl-CoA dioxygenase family)
MRTTTVQVEAFQRDGFAVFDEFLDAAAVDELRSMYDDILNGEVAGLEELQLGIKTRQVMNINAYIPWLMDSTVFKAAHEAAAELLQADEVRFGEDMLIYKPAGDPNQTPWHQDLAYTRKPAGTPNPRGQISFWIALDDVDVENGCMHFLPGLDDVLLEHVLATEQGAPGGKFLEVKDVEDQLDLSRAVACPIPAGGATAHNEGTPHYTPPNRSTTRIRRAYIPTWYNANHPRFFS